ncbi:MAG: metallophosphoesterase [Candidatus Omnitrophota bacterium]
MSKGKQKKIIVILVLAMIGYSFLPFIAFLFRNPASNENNNQVNVDKLKNNKGIYFSFIVFGDNHAGFVFNDAAAIKEIWHINREDRLGKMPIDFVLSAGDVTLNGKRSHYEAYKKLQGLIKYPVISVIGNHDERELFKEFCGKKEFSFANRNSYFIMLDNEIGELKEKQFEWLEDELKKGGVYDHIFVAMHKPSFDPYQQDWYNEDASQWTRRFRRLCSDYNVDMVFSGHKHMFKHEKFDGVDYIVSGGGGMLIEMPEQDGGYLHYVRVVVNGDYVTYEVRKISPPLWEYFLYYFWKEALYWARNFYGSGYIFGRNTGIVPIRK